MAKPGQSQARRLIRHAQVTEAPSKLSRQMRVEHSAANGNATQTEAVQAFEQASRSLQRHDYETAQAQFGELIRRFPDEHALVERSRVFAALCERAQRRPSPRIPETTEERLTAATAALNNGDDELAERLVTLALAQQPNHELGYYLLAMVHARRGVTADALDALDRAMAINPDVRAQALHDADFAALRDSAAFKQLLARPPARSGTGGSPAPRSG